jgi:hypothetical protein
VSALLEPLEYAFFRNGLAVSVLAGALCGLVGTFVVLRGMSYLGHGLSHAVFGAAAVGSVVGVGYYAAAGLGGLFTALTIGRLSSRRVLRADAVIGVVTTASLAVGVAALARWGQARRSLDAVLFGSILGVEPLDVGVIAFLAALTATVVALRYRTLLFATFDPEVAKAAGIRTAAAKPISRSARMSSIDSRPDRQADEAGVHTPTWPGRRRSRLLVDRLGELAVGGGSRVDDQAAHVADVGDVAVQLAGPRRTSARPRDRRRSRTPAPSRSPCRRSTSWPARARASLQQAGVLHRLDLGVPRGTRPPCRAFSLWRSMRRLRVSRPCRNRNELNGEMAAPRSRSSCTRALMMYEPCPQGRPVREAVVAGVGLGEAGNLSLAEKSNVPPSTITPPIDVPWPPMNLVAECTTMSAPHSRAGSATGEATVLSTISGTPFVGHVGRRPRMSRTSFFGLPMLSP